MKINLIEKLLGSGFYTGYAPKASGTFASIAAYTIFLIPGFENPTFMMLLISVTIVIAVKIANKFEAAYGRDPSQFTLDEFIGSWISLLFIPKKIWFIIPAFLIWRILDIYKPFPANYFDKMKGGWGVVLDDVISGFYTFIIIQLSNHLISRII